VSEAGYDLIEIKKNSDKLFNGIKSRKKKSSSKTITEKFSNKL
jgi:hypothetical protein